MHSITKFSFSFIFFFLFFFLLPFAVNSQTDYSVLNFWDYYSDAENVLYKRQTELSFQSLAKRREAIAKLKTQADWSERQQWVKEQLRASIGPFPEKTPLNAVITEKIKKENFSVEKLYYESLPGVKVTAAFFIPKGKGRNLPTIIYCSGHSDLAFRSDTYQHVILNLVKKGFAVFAFDPFGQGERQQYFDENLGKSKFGPTQEHSYPGAQLFINGASTAKFMIWDGIRAVDYLLTRKEVDPQRIGITGRSGGGTQSSYIAAFDERIEAAAPECYLTTLEYQLKTRGPQDAEQNFPNGIRLGLDHGDLLEVRAPKPAMMITTTRDIFSIQGARDTYREAQMAYKAFGQPENIMMVEDNAGHESTLKNREALYAFFQKYLNNPGSSKDEEVVRFPVEELHVSQTGQLSTSIKSKFLFDINADMSEKNRKSLDLKRKDMGAHLAKLTGNVKRISGFTLNQMPGKLIFSGQTEQESYFVNKYLIEQSENHLIPFVTFVPKKPIDRTVLYLDDLKNKKSDSVYTTPMQLAAKGITVIIPDLPGFGELGPGYVKGDAYFSNTSYNQWFAGILNGKSTVAIHAEAIVSLLHHYRRELGSADDKITGMAKGGFASSLLHAALLGVDFEALVLLDPMPTFEAIVSDKGYDPRYIPFTVAGALPYYDLPDLMAAFAPRKLLVYHETDTFFNDTLASSYDFVKEYYGTLNQADHFFEIGSNSGRDLTILFTEFQ